MKVGDTILIHVSEKEEYEEALIDEGFRISCIKVEGQHLTYKITGRWKDEETVLHDH